MEPKLKTKAQKVKVTQDISFSIVGAPLADVPLDVIAPATMYVILGLTENIYDWLLTMFSVLEKQKEEKTEGRATHQFHQAIVEARDTAKEYLQFLKNKFKDEIHTIEGKRDEAAKILKEIEKVRGKIATVNIGRPQAAWVRKLQVLRKESKKNETTPEEAELYEHFLAQVSVAEGTVEHMEDLLKAHRGDSEREMRKVLQPNNVDIDSYHGGSIVGNHCMNMAKSGNKIMDGMTAAMLPKIKDNTNRQHLQAISVRMKPILSLWFELMKTMKSINYQTDEDCKKFEENTIKLNKEIHSLITNPPVPGCGLKHSKQLKSHLLFD